jgi:hypothetical protein
MLGLPPEPTGPGIIRGEIEKRAVILLMEARRGVERP